MKIFNLTTGVIVLSMVLFACSQTPKNAEETAPEAELTIENLKEAITEKTELSDAYAIFSEAAKEEGMFNIAKMFTAAAEAEMIHVNSHQTALKALGVNDFEPTIEKSVAFGLLLVLGTLEKYLEAAIDAETHEFTEMYPVFIETANAENASDAVKSFKLAMEAEKRHAEHYKTVLELFKADGNDKNVPQEWYICLICGDLTPTIEGTANCSICGEKTEKFKKF